LSSRTSCLAETLFFSFSFTKFKNNITSEDSIFWSWSFVF
jgi:hypothetical protein